MRRKFVSCFAPILLAQLAATASAEPIRYHSGTDESFSFVDSPLVRYEGASGAFEPGSTLSLGRFVIDPSDATWPPAVDGVKFFLGVRTPDFDRRVPAGPTTTTYDTTSISGIAITGHFTEKSKPGEGPTITAVFDSIRLGDNNPIMGGWRPPYNFPVPLSDVKLPASIVFTGYLTAQGIGYSADVSVQITPEPATWAAWGLVGVGAILARRRSRASSR